MSKTDLNELYRGLHRLNRQMHRAAHRDRHEKEGIYHGQASLLLLVLENDGASQRDLAEQLDVRPSSMTEMLTRLEQSNLIVRKQDDKDQRIMRIYLTDEGKKAAKKIVESKDASTESLFHALSEEEQEQLLILVKKLCASMETDEDTYGHWHHGRGACHHGQGACRHEERRYRGRDDIGAPQRYEHHGRWYHQGH